MLIRDIVRPAPTHPIRIIEGVRFVRPRLKPSNPVRQPVKEHLFLQRLFFAGLFLAMGGSLILFVVNGFNIGVNAWEIYNKVYLSTLLVYTWFTLLLLFWSDVKKENFAPYNNEKISVIIPCYNEVPELLLRCIDSVMATKGNKEVVIVDDGSTNGTQPLLANLAATHGIKIHFFKKNEGKRHALHYAIKKLIGPSKYVVTIDSDTVLDEDALIRVVEPIKNENIGASTGNVLLLNEKQNWLTRMIGAYYWIGLNIYKRAQSSIGIVVCCSGCLAAYRRDIVDEIIDKFVNQEFFGEKCTHSEDRHLTNLVLQRNYQVVYIPEAISYTETPATVKGFLKQQQRWKRGYVRESLYTLSYAWQNKPILFLQILLWDLTIPFLSFGLMLALVASIVTNPMFLVVGILPSWIAFMIVRYMPLLLQARDKLPGLFLYMFFYDVFLYWQSVYALFTVKNKGWITR